MNHCGGARLCNQYLKRDTIIVFASIVLPVCFTNLAWPFHAAMICSADRTITAPKRARERGGAVRGGAHASASGERLGRPTRSQCVHDRALRHAVVEWCERNDRYYRLCGGAARDVAKLKDLAQRPPIYGAGSSGSFDYLDGPLLRAGSYGGDMQWVAVSDLLSCDIFTSHPFLHGDTRGGPGACPHLGAGAIWGRARW